VLEDAVRGTLQSVYEAGRIDAARFVSARWELLPQGRYMWGSVQTVRGCPKHCSFCSVWRTDGQTPRQRRTDVVVEEILELRRRGFRFVALADDNFYPVTLTDLALAKRQRNVSRLEQLRGLRAERFELIDRLANLPSDMVFFTQITMEAAVEQTISRRFFVDGRMTHHPGCSAACWARTDGVVVLFSRPRPLAARAESPSHRRGTACQYMSLPMPLVDAVPF
jgi:hypothetical protein